MVEFDIEHLLPRFILNDRNGYALAKALEAGFNAFCDKLQSGADTVLNVSAMPEWRLDERAWELGIIYDYGADIATKREWISRAIPMFAAYGTRKAITDMLSGMFDSVEIEENWQYGGDAFHFRVNVEGDISTEKLQWARKVVESVKNVRSVTDGYAAGGTDRIHIGDTGTAIPFGFPMAGESLCGELPEEE